MPNHTRNIGLHLSSPHIDALQPLTVPGQGQGQGQGYTVDALALWRCTPMASRNFAKSAVTRHQQCSAQLWPSCGSSLVSRHTRDDGLYSFWTGMAARFAPWHCTPMTLHNCATLGVTRHW